MLAEEPGTSFAGPESVAIEMAGFAGKSVATEMAGFADDTCRRGRPRD